MRSRAQLVVGILIVGAAIAAAVLSPWLAPYDPLRTDPGQRLSSPSTMHLLGTDALGRDTLSRLMYGARLSVGLPVLVTLLSSAFGALAGSAAGTIGGRADTLLRWVLDTLATLPGAILPMAILGLMGAGVSALAVALLATGWVPYARVARGLALELRGELFVTAAIASGGRRRWIIGRHIVPHLVGPTWALAAVGVGHTMLIMASLSFLGIGIQPPTPEWGVMLFQARGLFGAAPNAILYPGLCMGAVIAGFMLIGDSVTRA